MELESHLDQMIKDLSSEGPTPEQKANDIINDLNAKGMQKYLDAVYHILSLRDHMQITPSLFSETLEKITSISAKEYGDPLNILDLESKINFIGKYETQKNTLQKLGILQELPKSKKQGIIGIDGKEYPLPSLPEISQSISKEQLSLLQTKISQGFSEVLLVPFGLSIAKLAGHYKELLIQKNNKGKLYSSSSNPIQLNANNPLFIDSDYSADELKINPGIRYYPSAYSSEENGGYSKRELLERSKANAWHVALIEKLPDLPFAQEGKLISGRKQLESGFKPETYLRFLQNDSAYKGEQFTTTEDWLYFAASYLQQNNIQIDCVSEDDPGCYNLGSFEILFDNLRISYSHFSDQNRATIWWTGAEASDVTEGTRTIVPIIPLEF